MRHLHENESPPPPPPLSLSPLESITYDECEWFVPRFKTAKIVKVYDGDTMTAAVVFLNKKYKFSLRLLGVDTPEFRGAHANAPAATLARDAVRNLCLDKVVDVEITGTDKYGRLLAKVCIGSICINDYLIEQGLGKPYMVKS